VIGLVREVMQQVESNSGGRGNEGREFLFPMAHDICVEIDIKAKLIRVDLLRDFEL